MRHVVLHEALEATDAALGRRDYVAADRLRSSVYASGLPLSWGVAQEIGLRMAEAREADRRAQKIGSAA